MVEATGRVLIDHSACICVPLMTERMRRPEGTALLPCLVALAWLPCIWLSDCIEQGYRSSRRAGNRRRGQDRSDLLEGCGGDLNRDWFTWEVAWQYAIYGDIER